MGTESGDGLADRPAHEIATALRKVLWSKVSVEPLECRGVVEPLVISPDEQRPGAPNRQVAEEIHLTLHPGDAVLLAEYLRESERRPF